MKIIDFEFEKLSRQEKELEKLRKNSKAQGSYQSNHQQQESCIGRRL